MLVIRMQRTGRKGHAMFRVIVQDSRLTPTSGKVVAQLGSYDPHAKTVTLDKEKAAFYLEHGAQPSERATRLLKSEGVKLPDWVKPPANKERTVRNADKRRSTRPAEEVQEEAKEEAAPVEAAEEVVAEAAKEEPADSNKEVVAEAAESPEVDDKPEASEEKAEPEATPADSEEATEADKEGKPAKAA